MNINILKKEININNNLEYKIYTYLKIDVPPQRIATLILPNESFLI